MTRPHPLLMDLAIGAPLGPVDDARALFASAAEHRMTGLLFSAVQTGEVSLPHDAEQSLALYQLAIRRHHQALWMVLERLTATFDDAAIPLATLKGVTAEARWYDEVGQRPTHDLDLLIDATQPGWMDNAVALVQPEHPLRRQLPDVVSGTGLQAIDLEGPRHIAVDLHFDALKLGIPLRQRAVVWSRIEMLESPGGEAVPVLDAELSFLLHLFHALKDRFSYLIELTDVLRIVEREDLDWDFVTDFIAEEGLAEPASLALHTLYALLGLDGPTALPVPSGWRPRAWGRVWPEKICLNGHSGRIAHHRRQMLIPFLAKGRSGEALASGRFVILPPQPMLEYYHPDTRGPYPWRLAVGRLRRARERKVEVAAMTLK